MKLFEPIQVGPITLKNRIMLPPLTTGYEERDGSISPQSKAFYTRVAQGGAAYLVMGDVSPVPSFSPTPKLCDDSQIPGFAQLAESVHAHGAKLGVQIFHPEYDVEYIAGLLKTGDTKGVREKLEHDMLHFVNEVSEEQLLGILDKMVACAIRAQKAGIDAVEIHGDRLLGALCSTKMNRRTDRFGGDLAGRTRFALLFVEALKKAVPGMMLDYKLSIITPERGKGGIDAADAVEFAKLLEKAGVDMFHVAQGNHTGNLADTIPPMGVQGYGFFVELAGEIKAAVSVPVSAVGRIFDPKMAEGILATGKADIIALGRPLLTDPDWPNKAKAGCGADIRRCISCNKGCVDCIQNRAFLSCVLNPENGYEETRAIKPAQTPKTVVVVGGGPAGMEAARVAALRGHHVTLFERATALGGQLSLACLPPRKKEVARAIQDLSHAVRKAGVTLRLGEEATAEQILALKPQAVIAAVGAHNAIPPIPGVTRPQVCDSWKVLAGEEIVFGKVAIIGGGLVGCETAEFLAQEGCQVTIVEMLERIATGESVTVLPTLLESFKAHGVSQLLHTKVLEIGENTLSCQGGDGTVFQLPCDFVVMAAGAKPNLFDTGALESAGIPVTLAGDGVVVGDISAAMRTGYDAACAL